MSLDQLLTQLNFENRNRIKLDAVNLLASYRSLNAKIGTLSTTILHSSPHLTKLLFDFSVQNNGAALRVLDIDGTIPIVYGGTQVFCRDHFFLLFPFRSTISQFKCI
jgi:hypothetical protein